MKALNDLNRILNPSKNPHEVSSSHLEARHPSHCGLRRFEAAGICELARLAQMPRLFRCVQVCSDVFWFRLFDMFTRSNPFGSQF